MSLDPVKHKSVFIQILKDIYADSTIAPYLGFKGGTAALLFYGLDRFSVDLDFDLLDASQEDYVFERVRNILSKYGIIKDAQKKRFNLLFLLAYENKKPGAQNIKVEINRRSFGSKYQTKAYLGISMKVMVKEDMAAHKLCALLERLSRTNRDIFDVYFFLRHDWPINKEIITSRTKMEYKDFLKKCLDALVKVPNRNILSGMGELLTKPQKDWAKEKLLAETIFLLKLALSNEK